MSPTILREGPYRFFLGFWLLTEAGEYFVPFADYPAFEQATIAQIYNVQRLSPTQFHWPELDIDIELEALEHPEQFPLIFQIES